VHAYVNGEFGKMVALRENLIQMIPIAEIAGKNRFVEPGNDLIRAARDTGVYFGDE
jgi:6-phosphofructokinase 1